MQKNENLLLEPWITYHRTLVEPASIFIFDNGSSDAHTLSTLRDAENSGITINRSFCELKHYHDRGTIFANMIKHLDATNPHDFYFPMDCDEFMACEISNKPSCRINDIEDTLIPYLKSEKVLTILHKYVNNPYRPNNYSIANHVTKCFFAKDACEALTDGFHEGRSHSGPEQHATDIIYFEFHYKPYRNHLRMSFQKIEYLVPNPSRRNLANYVKTQKSNFHAALALLQSEYSYLRSFENPTCRSRKDTSLLLRFADLGINSSQFFDPRGNPNPLRRINLQVKHQLLRAVDRMDALFDWIRSLASSLKHL